MTTTKSKHTPGPWHVASENWAHSQWVVCDPEGGSIADCEPPGPWVSHETADANARIIAAAPELLSVLRDALWVIDNMTAILSAHGLCGTLTDPRPDMRAAIAKAVP